MSDLRKTVAKVEANGVSVGKVDGLTFGDTPSFSGARILTNKIEFSAEFHGQFDYEVLNRIFRDHKSAERLTRYFGIPTTVNGCAPL